MLHFMTIKIVYTISYGGRRSLYSNHGVVWFFPQFSGGRKGRLRLVTSPIDRTSFTPSSLSHNLLACLLAPHLLLLYHQQHPISFDRRDLETGAHIMNSCSCSCINLTGAVSLASNLWLPSSSSLPFFSPFLQMVWISCESFDFHLCLCR